MSKLLIEAHYFPCLEYFVNILEHDVVCIEAWESFQKQSYRNRCKILAANKVDVLSVPVVNAGRNVLIRDLKIEYTQKWMNDHWGAIRSAYGKAPFFEYYEEYFHDILFKKNTFLFDLNMDLLTLCLKLLKINKKIELTTSFDRETEGEIKDFRSLIHPKKQNISYIVTWVSYPQLFGRYFVENLSIIDLIFCEGNNAREILGKSKKGV